MPDDPQLLEAWYREDKAKQRQRERDAWLEQNNMAIVPRDTLAETIAILDYFANDRTDFDGSGTPLGVLAKLRAALVDVRRDSDG